ncbi:MAG: UDP-3-O-acyl-N-acetylglucosamine deacetylase, partial [Candidatus Rokubacteria bacterium]|nr:UDP-3-O-acyl-N-acetylglucosamine deacetylase [Candidatus Rokubacteria bacterium]
ILDLIGDLALLSRPVVGHVVARNAGHALNHELVNAIAEAFIPEARSSRATVRALSLPVDRLEGVRREPLPGIAAL